MKKIALFPALALSALTSTAIAAEPTTIATSQQVRPIELSNAQMDKITAGDYNNHYAFNNSAKSNDAKFSGNSNQWHCINCY